MVTTFNQVPDWTPWQIQGANVATADLDGEGSPELMVLRIDRPTPDRIEAPTAWAEGWIRPAMSRAGDPGAKFPVGVQRINRALAVVDFGRARRALVVFQIKHNEPGPNRRLFRIGRR